MINAEGLCVVVVSVPHEVFHPSFGHTVKLQLWYHSKRLLGDFPQVPE